MKSLKNSIKNQVKNVGLLLIASAAMATQASIIEINPGDPAWNGDANSAITANAPRSGNASVQLQGDRTRFYGLGNPFDPLSNIGLLADLLNFNFEWNISSASSNSYHPDYTPALRLHIWDGAVRSELIWEGAYNNVYGNISKDTWYQTDFNDNFYQWVAGGPGVTEIYNRTLTDWQSLYSSSAVISGVSMGAGSGVSSSYLAFADNLNLQLANSNFTYNFELEAASVPEPAGIVLFASGLLLLFRRFKAK